MADDQFELIASDERSPVQVSQPDNLMGALINAAMNPDIDADKMERMLAMYERMEERKAKVEFDEALAQMLPEIPEIGKTGVATKAGGGELYKFAKWDQMNRVLRPILQKHGFALTFRTQEHEKGVLVTGVLSRGGHSETTSLLQSLESASSAMNANQARGNAVSYGKRYTAAALLNIITTDEQDNDASGLSGDTLSEQQVEEILGLVKRLGGEHSVLLEWAKMKHGVDAPAIEALPIEMFDTVRNQLNHWIKLREAKNAG